MAVTKTLGSGGDYADWAACFTALSGHDLTDDWVIIQFADLTLSADALLDNINLNGHRLFFISNPNPAGNPTAGVRTHFANNASLRIGTFTGSIQNGTVVFQWMTFENSPGAVPILGLLVIGLNTTISLTMVVEWCLFKSGGTAIYIESYSNFIGWNCAFLTVGLAIDGHINGTPVYQIENISCIGTGAGGSGGIGFALNLASSWTGTIQNVYAETWNGHPAGPTFQNNASGDGTAVGSASLINVSAAAFVSKLWSSASFAKLTTGGVLNDVGAVPVRPENTTGIRGNMRPHQGVYSIGADEALVIPQLIAPITGSAQRLGQPVLRWAPVIGATSYEVYVAQDVGGTVGLMRFDVTTTEIQRGFAFGMTFYWRVRAIIIGIPSEFSSEWNFVVPAFSPAPDPNHVSEGKALLLDQFLERA